MRTVDMERIAPAYAVLGKDLFSLEMWGGATFDTSYRFLKESPWERLAHIARKTPKSCSRAFARGKPLGYKIIPIMLSVLSCASRRRQALIYSVFLTH